MGVNVCKTNTYECFYESAGQLCYSTIHSDVEVIQKSHEIIKKIDRTDLLKNNLDEARLCFCNQLLLHVMKGRGVD